jgi:hypothetical protein
MRHKRGNTMKDKQRKKPVSPEKLAANRNNSKRSPGPQTPEGKQRSSQNAFKHGFYSDRAFPTQELIDRDGEGYLRILAAYRSQYAPVGDLENYYVEQIAVLSLRLARILEHEQKVLHYGSPFEFPSMDRIVRYESNLSRLRDKTVDRLERVQAARKAEASQFEPNLEADEASSNTDEATEEPRDVSTPSSVPAVPPAAAPQLINTGAKQGSAPVNEEQSNKTPETPEGSAPASGSILTKAIEKVAGLPPAEEHTSSLGSHDNHETDSIGSDKWIESREDEEMIERYKRGDDIDELY